MRCFWHDSPRGGVGALENPVSLSGLTEDELQVNSPNLRLEEPAVPPIVPPVVLPVVPLH